MSDFGCIGKLPFTMMDSIQRPPLPEKGYWADAVPIRGHDQLIMSIDAIALDAHELPKSAALAVLHAANDIYARGGIPKTISIALQLPNDSDIDLIKLINSAIVECSVVLGCSIGKMHTQRLRCSMATVSIVGKLVSPTCERSAQGEVWLLDQPKSWLELTLDPSTILATAQLRKTAAESVFGPKKDVSGDGLIGSILQLALRERVEIKLDYELLLDSMQQKTLRCPGADANYLDYAAHVKNLHIFNPSLDLLNYMFCPCVFGPIVCLIKDNSVISTLNACKIGTFLAGDSTVELT